MRCTGVIHDTRTQCTINDMSLTTCNVCHLEYVRRNHSSGHFINNMCHWQYMVYPAKKMEKSRMVVLGKRWATEGMPLYEVGTKFKTILGTLEAPPSAASISVLHCLREANGAS